MRSSQQREPSGIFICPVVSGMTPQEFPHTEMLVIIVKGYWEVAFCHLCQWHQTEADLFSLNTLQQELKAENTNESSSLRCIK